MTWRGSSMAAITLPKGVDTMLFARRLAELNAGRVHHNGYLRVSAPGWLRIPRTLFQEVFAGLDGAAAETGWNALPGRCTGVVTQFTADVIEVEDAPTTHRRGTWRVAPPDSEQQKDTDGNN